MHWRYNAVLKAVLAIVAVFVCNAEKSLQCSCPADSCMSMPDSEARCQCCVFVFLGKRSGPGMSDKTPKPITILQDNNEYKLNQEYTNDGIRLLKLIARLLSVPSLKKNRRQTNAFVRERNSIYGGLPVYNFANRDEGLWADI